MRESATVESTALEVKTVYFKTPGKENTEATFRIANERAEELGIKTLIVASTRGNTAVKAMDVLKGKRVVIVTQAAGFHEPNTQEFTEENRKIVESKGGITLTTAHAFGGLSRAMHGDALPSSQQTYVVGTIIAHTLRMFGHGVKVACEITVMAADAGLVRTDEDVIAVAGTGRGADVAIVVRPAYSESVFKLKIREILCKPHF